MKKRKYIITVIFSLVIVSIFILINKNENENSQNQVRMERKVIDYIENNDIDNVKKLIETNNIDINRINALHKSCELGNSEISLYLIEKGADINKLDVKTENGIVSGMTPLAYGIKSGNKELVEMLIDKGANVNIKVNGTSAEGQYPIYYAVAKGYLSIVKLLVDNGSNISFVDINGESLLHYAATGHNTDIFDYLVEKGLNPNLKDNYGRSPLLNSLLANDLNMTEHLINKYSLDIHEVAKSGRNLLHYCAIYSCRENVFTYLFEKGASTTLKDDSGFVPFFYTLDNFNKFKLFLNYGHTVNIKSENNDNLLHISVHQFYKKPNVEIINYLLEKGVNPQELNNDNKSPIDICTEKKLYDIKELMEQYAR